MARYGEQEALDLERRLQSGLTPDITRTLRSCEDTSRRPDGRLYYPMTRSHPDDCRCHSYNWERDALRRWVSSWGIPVGADPASKIAENTAAQAEASRAAYEYNVGEHTFEADNGLH